MAMNEVNGIQGRLRSSAVRWGTVHNPTNQRKCDFYGEEGESTSGPGTSNPSSRHVFPLRETSSP